MTKQKLAKLEENAKIWRFSSERSTTDDALG